MGERRVEGLEYLAASPRLWPPGARRRLPRRLEGVSPGKHRTWRHFLLLSLLLLAAGCGGADSPVCRVSQVNGGIQQQLEKEVVQYDYRASFFDIFVSL